ncbi:hypothetical protein H0H81_011719 [Sphagnurus paluster]|uniref:F-box domain-containing protein n=1 Tax=Sphagnurus paluster TaxID=117069 RepID=A0A9P7K3V8_9AGAR|nr:hypothetical protein H0H81_011719 [Sphagnurus paluster]
MKVPANTSNAQFEHENKTCKIFAPIRLLPLETLIEIFSYTVKPWSVPRIDQAPMSVSQVCSTWRQASFMCPVLWKTLKIDGLADHPDNFQSNILSWWFERANRSSLSFSLSQGLVGSNHKLTERILDALFPFSHRLAHLHLSVTSLNELDPFLSDNSGTRLPLLKKLDLGVRHDPVEIRTIGVFRSASALRDATLGIPSDILAISSYFAFPWGQLTRLTIVSPLTSSAFSWIIIQCEQLVYASLFVDVALSSGLEDPPSPLPVTLAHLSTLILKVDDCSDDSTLEDTLDRLVLPSLKKIQFSISDTESQFKFSKAIPSLEYTSLTCLVIVNGVSYPYELSHVLKLCNALEELAIENVRVFACELLETLLRCAYFLPSLTSFVFVFEDEDFDDELAEIFSELVQEWARDPARRQPLKAVTLYGCGVDDECAKEVFSDIRDMLVPWREADEEGSVAVSQSGMVLCTRAVTRPFDLAAALQNWFDVEGDI